MKKENIFFKVENDRRSLYTRINTCCGIVTAMLRTPFYYRELYQSVNYAINIENELEDEIDQTRHNF
jgi:hypothetical protein